jgi:hypothetical protein
MPTGLESAEYAKAIDLNGHARSLRREPSPPSRVQNRIVPDRASAIQILAIANKHSPVITPSGPCGERRGSLPVPPLPVVPHRAA